MNNTWIYTSLNGAMYRMKWNGHKAVRVKYLGRSKCVHRGYVNNLCEHRSVR